MLDYPTFDHPLRTDEERPRNANGVPPDDEARREASHEHVGVDDESLRTAFERHKAVMLLVDPESGQVVDANIAAAEFYGYPREVLCAMSIREINALPPDEVARERQLALSGRKNYFLFPHKLANGEIRTVEVYSSPIDIRNKRLLFSIIHDVTERRRIEEQCARAQRLEAVGALAAAISHDFNNALQAITGYADLIERDLADNGRKAPYIKEIVAACDRARDLVCRIVAFSGQIQGDLMPLSLQPVIAEALKAMADSLPQSISVERAIDPACGPVVGDAIRLQQVVMNLCMNARDAMRPTGGTLTVSLKQVFIGTPGQPRPADLPAGPYARLSVADTGCGMSARTLARIFDPYFTTKPLGEGAGLGLSLVHGLVAEARGAVLADSTPGKGSRFDVLLPCYIAPTVDTKLSGNERVLVVDDEGPVARATANALRRYGYRVKACSSSEEAGRLFLAAPDEFDLVITDQTMPGLTGTGLAAILQAARPDIPILLCTGYSDLTEDPQQPRPTSPRGFLAKPFAPETLAQEVRRLLDTPPSHSAADSVTPPREKHPAET